MSHLYNGADSYPASITLPDDLDAADAASVNVALEGLADRTRYLKGIHVLSEVAHRTITVGDVTTVYPSWTALFPSSFYKIDGETFVTITGQLSVTINQNAASSSEFRIVCHPPSGPDTYWSVAPIGISASSFVGGSASIQTTVALHYAMALPSSGIYEFWLEACIGDAANDLYVTGGAISMVTYR